MEITYYLEDGYANAKGRPHTVTADDEELSEMNDQEKEKYIEELVQEDFQNNISFYWDRNQIKK